MSCAMSGQALGIVIGALLAQFISWKFLFVCVGLAAVPAAVMFYKQTTSAPATQLKVDLPLKERYRQIFANPRSWILYLAVFLEGAALFGGFAYLGIYANKFLGLNYFTIGLLTAGFSFAAFIGTRIVPSAITRVGLPKMPFVGTCILTLAYAAIWLIPHWVGLMTGFFIMGVGFSIIHTALQTYATELLPPARATCMSLFAFFLFLGNGIGPVCLGWVYELSGPQGMLAVTTAGMALFTGFCSYAFRRFASHSPLRS